MDRRGAWTRTAPFGDLPKSGFGKITASDFATASRVKAMHYQIKKGDADKAYKHAVTVFHALRLRIAREELS